MSSTNIPKPELPASNVTLLDGGNVESKLDTLTTDVNNKVSKSNSAFRTAVYYGQSSSNTITITRTEPRGINIISLQHDGGNNNLVCIWIGENVIQLSSSGEKITLVSSSYTVLTFSVATTYFMVGSIGSEVSITRS